MIFSAPIPLSTGHRLAGFSCGEAVLDSWLCQRALKNEAMGASRTYVVCAGVEATDVVGYYSLAVGSIEHQFTPGGIRRNMPQPIPVMLLARLAVDVRCAGQGIGTGMLQDALLRTLQAADIAGIRALLVHALHDKAAAFYQKQGFVPSPFAPLVLFLSLDFVRKHNKVAEG
ncbi:MAG: GNAT family N-acetyltransferase [Desulfovibrionaceae bacterium]|nr:GNAT family N-acetyltransferase [Desulfovibrionaceae bacterium]